MALDPKQLFDIQSEFTPTIGGARFGKTIFITIDDTLGVQGTSRARDFISYNEVLKFFENKNPLSGATGKQTAVTPTTEPVKAVQAYYKQQQNNPIQVVRWIQASQNASLTGGVELLLYLLLL